MTDHTYFTTCHYPPCCYTTTALYCLTTSAQAVNYLPKVVMQ